MTLVDRSLRRQLTAAMALAMALALLLSGTALAQTTADEVEAVPIDDSCNDVPEDGFTDVPETNTFDDEIEWFQPHRRALFPITGISVSRSLRRTINKGTFDIRFSATEVTKPLKKSNSLRKSKFR